jgi:hypothetical protein
LNSNLAFCYAKQGIEGIVWRKLISPRMPALHTPMQYENLAVLLLIRDRFHHSFACGFAIARMHIHMLTPQTFRTVVSVPAAFNISPALLARKVFWSFLKLSRHF